MSDETTRTKIRKEHTGNVKLTFFSPYIFEYNFEMHF